MVINDDVVAEKRFRLSSVYNVTATRRFTLPSMIMSLYVTAVKRFRLPVPSVITSQLQRETVISDNASCHC